MSVYIHGMEMPKDECVGIFVYPDGRVHVWRSMSLVGQEYKAVPVPLHGRLGDLDELYKTAVERSEKIDGYFNCLDKVISAYDIESAPTIIPAEEGET